MHTRNSNQALLKSPVRRLTSPGNLLGRKNISVTDKFVATYTHTHIQGTVSHTHTDHCSPHTYRLLSVHTHRPLKSVHMQATERTHIQATAVRTHTGYRAYTHTGYWAYTHTGHYSPYTYRLLQTAHVPSSAVCKYVQSVHAKNKTMLTTTKFPSTTL
jgi:hypothetical protein